MIQIDVLTRGKDWLLGDIGDVSDGQNDTSNKNRKKMITISHT
jgi:hypothetical protein